MRSNPFDFMYNEQRKLPSQLSNRSITRPVNPMDYEFNLNAYDQPIAEFSSGFEALGRWFSEQLKDEPAIAELLYIIEDIEEQRIPSRQLFSEDSHLLLTHDEVEVKALALESDIEDEDIPENTRLYDDEGHASCGLPDFKHALLSWQQFI